MPPIVQPRLKRVPSSTALRGDPTAQGLTESPATETPPIEDPLLMGTSSGAGFPIYEQYERDLIDYRTIFNKNMKNKPKKHDRVQVLIWTWGNDDLGVQDEVDRLETVFKERYNFGVERKILDDLEKAEHQLNEFLSSFMKRHDEPNTLLIFYYAGHGLYDDNTVIFTGNKQHNPPEELLNIIAWSSAEHNIKAKRADVLLVLDCCHAGAFGGFNLRAGRQTPFQCIAACGPLDRTVGPGETSFTSALIWALEELQSLAPFTSIALVDKIREYDKLHDPGSPMLLRRDVYNDSMVWIAPQRMKQTGSATPKSERRGPLHEYMDIRLNFYRRINKSDAEMVAKCLSHLIHHNKSFQAKHISLLDKTSTHMKVVRRLASSVQMKRKRSTTSSLDQSPGVLGSSTALTQYTSDLTEAAIDDALSLRPSKRMRLGDLEGEPTEPPSALYHLRMALHCTLQNVTSQIGRIADRVRPRSEQTTDGDLSDID